MVCLLESSSKRVAGPNRRFTVHSVIRLISCRVTASFSREGEPVHTYLCTAGASWRHGIRNNQRSSKDWGSRHTELGEDVESNNLD